MLVSSILGELKLEAADDAAKSIVIDYYKLDEEMPPEIILLMESKYGYIELNLKLQKTS